jgi:hypothetical protein
MFVLFKGTPGKLSPNGYECSDTDTHFWVSLLRWRFASHNSKDFWQRLLASININCCRQIATSPRRQSMSSSINQYQLLPPDRDVSQKSLTFFWETSRSGGSNWYWLMLVVVAKSSVGNNANYMHARCCQLSNETCELSRSRGENEEDGIVRLVDTKFDERVKSYYRDNVGSEHPCNVN